MGAARKYPDELRDRAVRLVLDQVKEQETSVTAACRKVGAELGINADTLRGWAKQVQIDRGLRPGTSSADAAHVLRHRCALLPWIASCPDVYPGSTG
jgi:transposase